jgi:RHS repeat-associated protein
MPSGSTAYGSTAPQGSPPMVVVQPGQVLRIRATGHTRSDGSISTRSPDGSLTNTTGTVSNAANGISSFASPNHGSLLGVFLDDDAPSGKTPPEQLDFRTAGNVPGGIQYTSIAPQLRQLFFIGDGFTSTGIEQTLVVPAGATRLFLANSSSSSWTSNTGSFEVQVFTSSPEPVQAGRVVYLDSNRNQQFDPGEPTSTTDAQGRYSLATVGSSADVGLVGIAGQLQRTPSTAVSRVALNTVTPTLHFGSRSAPAGELPIFLSEPFGQATAPGSYAYQVFAQSPSASRLSYELASGPEGMAIDRESGLIQWNPLASQAGSHDILVKASDAQKRFSIQRYSLTAAINTPPIITSIAPQQSQLGVAWRYRMRAQDAEQSALSYRLVSAPAGMTISASTGVIDYVPSVLGPSAFEVEVTDGAGGSARQSSSVTVVPPQVNNPPQWMQGLAPTAIVQRNYAAQLVATDADAEPLTYGLVSGPAGLTVSSSGQVLWEPSETGTFSVTIAVSDTRGGRAERTDSIQVVSRVPRSTLQIESQPETAARTGQLYAYDVLAPGAVLFELIDAPVGMSIDPQHGSIRWLPTRDSLGVKRIQLRCSDLFGNSVTQEFSIAVRSSSIVPMISSAPLTEAVAGRTYLYSVRTSNPSGSPLQFELSVGPNGMQIDPQSGVVSWTPSAAQVGPTTVLLRVRDGLGNFSTQSYSISVGVGDSNRAPVIGSMAGFDGVVGEAYRYTLQATDPEGGALTYAVRSAPSGFSIDATTGVVTWTPVTADVGTVAVVLTATDPQGGAAVQSYQIDVRPANRAPEFRSNPNQRVSQGGLYRYDVLAIDPDRESLAYELIESPPGMTIDAMGRVRWQTPLDTPLGARDVAIRIRDGLGATATQRYTMLVEKDTQAPRLTIVVTGEPVLYPWTVHPAIVRVIATDNVGLASVELKVDGETVELAPDGTARVYFSAPGNGRLLATATDAAGNRGTATGRVNMRSGEEDGSGNPAPEANITSVGNGASVRGFVDVVGTALSPDFERYTLSYRRVDQTDYKLIRESTIQVSAASLGKWDTTLLENDNYVLKLEVHDTFGSFAAVEVEVSVTGNLKLGNFRLSFEDMTIPVAGIPITIVRTYDTLRADRDGDFGYGWRMEYRNTDLRTSLPKSGLEDIGIFTPFKGGTKVFVTMPGGTREGFTFTPEYKVLPGFGSNNNLVVAFPKFTSDRGVASTLRAGSGTLLANEYGELFAAAGVPWNPASPDFGGYTLTTREGLEYRIDGASGLMTSVLDRNGLRVQFGYEGISSSAEDTKVEIQRGADGRISAIVDLAGSVIRYHYSPEGNLTKVIDREGNATEYSYHEMDKHYLKRVVDPLGRTGLLNEYDSNGRLVSQEGIGGKEIQYAYDPDNSVLSTTDAIGRRSIIEYDEHGNIVRVVRPDGSLIQYSYDSQNNLISEENALGHKTSFAFDSRSNLTSTTDALGYSAQYSYGVGGQLTSITNALGETTRFTLDAKGNIVKSEDALGRTTQFQLTPAGLPVKITNSIGLTTEMEYDAAGRPKNILNPDGSTIQYSYDVNGNLASQSDGQFQFRFGYTAQGHPNQIETPNGDRKIQYDAAGRVLGAPGGGSIKYDSADRVTSIEIAGRNLGHVEFDPVGNLSVAIDMLGNEVRHQYNELNLRTRSDYPDGSAEQFEYDKQGQLVKFINRRGAIHRFEYDALGRVIREIDPLGAAKDYTYDPVGNMVSKTDGDGNLIRMEYEGSYLLRRIVDPTGKATSYQYDDAGRLLSMTDGGGLTTRYAYDNLNRINSTFGPGQAIATFEHGSFGILKSVDPNGAVTETQYNAKGQVSRIIYPGNIVEEREYDEVGLLSKVSVGSRWVHYEYNDFGGIAAITTSDGTADTFAYTVDGLLASTNSAQGMTRYEYDSQSRRVIRVTEPDGRYVRYAYDTVGNRTLIAHGGMTGITEETVASYFYDLADRLVKIVDPAGQETLFEYTRGGRLTTIRRANGIDTIFSHDRAGRIARVTHRSDEGNVLHDWQYKYDGSGNRSELINADGSRVLYGYSASGNLTSERHFSNNGELLKYQDYQYDSGGNMIRRSGSLLGDMDFYYNSAQQLIATSDASYSYDEAGNLSAISTSVGTRHFKFDARDRLVSVQSAESSEISFHYDHQGRMIGRSDSDGMTKYLIDRFTPNSLYVSIAESGPAGTKSYTNANGPLSVLDGSEMRYLLRDALGSIRGLANSEGQAIAEQTYSAFGSPIEGFGDVGIRRFAGEQLDSTTDLYNLRARLYDPNTGRFVSRDPVAFDSMFIPCMNTYSYAQNNPTTLTDPSGFASLAELQTTLQLKAQQFSQQTVRFGRAYDRISDALGIAATRTGGLMIAASLSAPKLLTRALFAYFGSGFVQGATNLLKIGVDMLGGKQVEFKDQPFPPHLYKLVDGQFAIAWFLRDESSATKAKFALMPGFLYLGLGGGIRPFLPVSTYGEPSMAGIMVHEMSHSTLNTRDIGYGTKNLIIGGQGLSWTPDPNQKVKTPTDALNNADSYRATAESVTVGQLPSVQKLVFGG